MTDHVTWCRCTQLMKVLSDFLPVWRETSEGVLTFYSLRNAQLLSWSGLDLKNSKTFLGFNTSSFQSSDIKKSEDSSGGFVNTAVFKSNVLFLKP